MQDDVRDAKLDSFLSTEGRKIVTKEMRSGNVSLEKKLADLSLGIKQSRATQQWREREAIMHAHALNDMASPLRKEIEKHRENIKQASEITKFGKRNKESAMKLQLARIKQQNSELLDRLTKAARSKMKRLSKHETENDPRTVLLNNRKKYVREARHNTLRTLDAANAEIFRRIVNVTGTLEKKDHLEKSFQKHLVVKKTMSRLQEPPQCTSLKDTAAKSRKPRLRKQRSLLLTKHSRESDASWKKSSIRKHRSVEIYLKKNLPPETNTVFQSITRLQKPSSSKLSFSAKQQSSKPRVFDNQWKLYCGDVQLVKVCESQSQMVTVKVTVFDRPHNSSILIEALIPTMNLVRFLEMKVSQLLPLLEENRAPAFDDIIPTHLKLIGDEYRLTFSI